MSQTMKQQINDVATAAVAVSGVTLPFWIQVVSGWAQVILPILGALWLIIQIYYRVKENHDRSGPTGSTKREEKDSEDL